MDEKFRKALFRMELELLQAKRRQLFASKPWADDVSAEPGVYAIWEVISNAPVYVGESSCLRSRMSDLGRTVNHTFRRTVARLLGVEMHDERALSQAMSERYVVSFIEVQLGRAELEEYLVLRWRQMILNKPAKRLLRGERYKWVEPANPTECIQRA